MEEVLVLGAVIAVALLAALFGTDSTVRENRRSEWWPGSPRPHKLG